MTQEEAQKAAKLPLWEHVIKVWGDWWWFCTFDLMVVDSRAAKASACSKPRDIVQGD
jgi:hypothetical protein